MLAGDPAADDASSTAGARPGREVAAATRPARSRGPCSPRTRSPTATGDVEAYAYARTGYHRGLTRCAAVRLAGPGPGAVVARAEPRLPARTAALARAAARHRRERRAGPLRAVPRATATPEAARELGLEAPAAPAHDALLLATSTARARPPTHARRPHRRAPSRGGCGRPGARSCRAARAMPACPGGTRAALRRRARRASSSPTTAGSSARRPHRRHRRARSPGRCPGGVRRVLAARLHATSRPGPSWTAGVPTSGPEREADDPGRATRSTVAHRRHLERAVTRSRRAQVTAMGARRSSTRSQAALAGRPAGDLPAEARPT